MDYEHAFLLIALLTRLECLIEFHWYYQSAHFFHFLSHWTDLLSLFISPFFLMITLKQSYCKKMTYWLKLTL